ncbi:TIR domain-containing protein [Turneriella parva]|uniref:Thoeris protein ThsB TIR-like domain-containing protein n=1 Tax=Turneriella parva (strain ATCC BAA-1111 / DSM 21527 / NCTC 11395 / H) TaxID=869212 RepID=I4BA91_TURPD|nr:TIR domain-containing protein [Turneriella parva]AFM14198.1 protein of unknown function DUF1863 [Turneriella parva DSM 21527]
MARSAFYSFHFGGDSWRAAQVRQMGVIEGNQPVNDNDWETVKRGGDSAIQRWIDGQLFGKSVTIVLIGRETAGRRWISYEIEKSWSEGKGLLGIHIHNLKDSGQRQDYKGQNPFAHVSINFGRLNLGGIVPVYDPPYTDSTWVYSHIKSNLASWIEEAIAVRNRF